MKILYSHIRELVPGLKAGAREVGEMLTMIGFMMDSFEDVEYGGEKDHLIGLEVRQNRADCLSTIGIAREVAAYYGLEVRLPEIGSPQPGMEELKIHVQTKDKVHRIVAAKLIGVTNAESPSWLVDFLNFHGIKSINLLVDLSNYVMLITGYPSHLLDVAKLTEPISWSLNEKFSSVVTLDGTEFPLSKKNELVIHDNNKVLALAGIVGSQSAAITIESNIIIAEMALYDRALIRENARSLKIVTEASIRLEKDLDPSGLDYAMNLLLHLIIKHCGGSIETSLFSYYPQKRTVPEIMFDPKQPALFAGIAISDKKALEILRNLRFSLKKKGQNYQVTPPSDRMDILLEEDAIEEVIRMVRFDNIPADQTPALQVTKDITPLLIPLSEKMRDLLTAMGFDEILSWTLTTANMNKKTNHLNWDSVTTQNSVNDENPDLRQSIGASLLHQESEYKKKNIEFIELFEIGKIFGKKSGKFLENESLGILSAGNKEKTLSDFKKNIETLLRSSGINAFEYIRPSIIPEIANPLSLWNIEVSDKPVGIICKLLPEYGSSSYFAEINLSLLAEIIPSFHPNPAVELTKKLVTLDANVELKSDSSIETYLKHAGQNIGPSNIWSIRIADAFSLKDVTRYTIRVSYKEMGDKEAKELHAKVFNLENTK